MSDNSVKNKQIAKNTVYLYIRTIILMIITLYTSRVVLDVLGVEDYGVYNVVGGVVAMFTVITGSLSASISRYITYELGQHCHDLNRLKSLFSMSLKIQFVLGAFIILLGETLGLWFVNTQLNIPPERMIAANWVWQCVLLTFFVNLLSVPYNACIVAHEYMDAFAIVSIIDAVLKLLICYMLIISAWDKLITYALLQITISIIIFFIYKIYCSRHFHECRYKHINDKSLMNGMMSFAGYSFLNNAANILNTQGLNILINIFFGVVLNAARGIASQVESAVLQLVNNFTLAVNPQITKSYAAHDKIRMFQLVCIGSKFAYFMMLFIAIPVFIETEFILKLWLKTVPDYTVIFLRLSLIGGMIKMLGNTGYTACMATGNIKKYSIWITSVGILAFPFTWVAFRMGATAEYAYYVFITIYVVVEAVRLILMKQMLDFPPMMFVKEVILRITIVTSIAIVLPFVCLRFIDDGWLRFMIILIVSPISNIVVVYALGLTTGERQYILNLIKTKIGRK